MMANLDRASSLSPEKTLTPRQVRLVQSIADFQMALSALDFLSDLGEREPISRIDRRRFRCFEDAAIIAYGRPFTDAKGLPKLSFKQVGLKAEPHETALHNRIMERRHKVVAHSDADRQRIAFTSHKVFDDVAIMLPHMDFDDALEFYSDRLILVDWINKLVGATSKTIFDAVQELAPIRFIRDHTLGSVTKSDPT